MRDILIKHGVIKENEGVQRIAGLSAAIQEITEEKDNRIKELEEIIQVMDNALTGVSVYNGLSEIDDDFIENCTKSISLLNTYKEKYAK